MTETESKLKKEEAPERKKYAYFSGCVIPIQLPEIEKLTRDILPKIGIDLVDFDFSCCPSSGVRDINTGEWLLTAARNISLADEKKLDIISVCTGCSQTLIEAKHEIKGNRDLKNEINEKLKTINRTYKGTNDSYNLMMVLDELKEDIKSKIIKPLTGLRIATHSGCHLLKPSRIIGYDNAENPVKFDEFVEILGAKAVDYQTKTLCCGYEGFARHREMSLSIMKDKLDELDNRNIDLLTLVCPTCFRQYDKNSRLLKKELGVEYNVPVVHILQLLGLALGMSVEDVFLKRNRTVDDVLVKKINKIIKK
ncbi:MAG: CoB--CoM heterodisulfide reductase iron-sulfur subunit B family protein [Promethearchaeota archaeon]